MRERRAEDRLLCAELVEVIWDNNSGREQRKVANLEDISPNGICLQTERAITVESSVTVRCRQGEFTGTVRYCLFRGIGYFVGIQFTGGVKWCTQEYEPEHLLDPQLPVREPRPQPARAARGLRLVQ
ncbi:MAG: PilZ domain-containing protein [Acidobacteriaceae bacterium]|nr:PilZ domain-containing protein [Acidobacteriaceae bacterium]